MTQDEIEEIAFKWTGKRPVKNVDAETFIEACERGDIDFVRSALEHTKSLVNAQDKHGDTALMKAAGGGKKSIVKLLIDNGANASIKDHLGFTALHWALDNGDFDIVALLVNAGADINAKDSVTGCFPLEKAAGKGYYNIVQLLLSNGANVNERSNGPFGGCSALKMAEMSGHTNIMNLLRAYGAEG